MSIHKDINIKLCKCEVKEIIESYQWIIDDIDEVGSTQDEVLIGVYHSLTKQLKEETERAGKINESLLYKPSQSVGNVERKPLTLIVI